MNGMAATGGLYIDEQSKATTKTWTVEKPNGQVCLNSRDRRSGTVAAPRTQPWNDFSIQTRGQNIMQGAITTIKLQEIRLPYAIPNVNERTNFFSLYVYDYPETPPGGFTVGVPLTVKYITITEGWYTGTELVAAINAALTTAFTATPAIKPTVSYDDVGNIFTFTAATDTAIEVQPFNYNTAVAATQPNYSKSLLSIMGIVNFYGGETTREFSGQWASLSYTQYLDICSPTLTTYQDLADTSTFEIVRREIICRVYITDEISVNDPFGVRPFTVHRQFVNPKTMKWNGKDSLSRINLQIFDDVGQPAYEPANGLPDFQITFTVAE